MFNMFEQDSFEHLAELYIQLNDSPLKEQLYCLCSRSILRPDILDDDKIPVQDYIDTVTNEDVSTIRFLNSSTESQPSTVHVIKKKEPDDGVSCYCSASHCSTDDSTRDAPHSDSGADLSETSRDPGWEYFWAKHGESIIWESWIEKYGDYVDPAYSRESRQPYAGTIEGLPDLSNENSDVTRLSFCSEISDSFTNVTPLTLSELSTEDSSLMSSSDSAGSVSNDIAQWQALWADHYNFQYQLTYENYKAGIISIEGKGNIETKANLSGEEKVDDYLDEDILVSPSYRSSRRRNSNLHGTCVGTLLNTLRSINMDQEESLSKELNMSKSPLGDPENSDSKCIPNGTSSDLPEELPSRKETFNQENISDSDHQPTSSYDSTSDLKTSLKRPHNREDDRLRGAFNLIGLTYHGEGVSGGSVFYKKRNIRWQNRMLHLNLHLHFDEDGQVITKDKKTDRKPVASDKWHIADTCEMKSDFSEKDDSSEGEFNSASEESESKKEKRKKKRKRKGLPKEIADNERLLKFWYQRYRLFSKFDEGIKLDEESWYSVTPEKVSRHTAERCRCDLIIDAFCGAGGNSIQFAFTCERVIAIDIDPHKIELAKHNAKIYGVEDRIEFIVGDFFKVAPTLHADVVFLSPPWGGLDYASQQSYNLDNILPPIGGIKLFEVAAGISPNIAIYLPRNVNSDELLRLSGPVGNLEMEQNFLGKKLIAVTAYFGELIGSCPSEYL